MDTTEETSQAQSTEPESTDASDLGRQLSDMERQLAALRAEQQQQRDPFASDSDGDDAEVLDTTTSVAAAGGGEVQTEPSIETTSEVPGEEGLQIKDVLYEPAAEDELDDYLEEDAAGKVKTVLKTVQETGDVDAGIVIIRDQISMLLSDTNVGVLMKVRVIACVSMCNSVGIEGVSM